ncbi:FAD:protein FMN transferase [Candidatus Parabeggiatoa sp. HSG14]|uniref:FAD:protein FMN transferase n=1 Tax=Candidatus Parabeggiatoa sp. HSG14 TaxID=3055593 RepID=UPI0025A858C1|nr:FAD:protein FMN transferase [Thiotrichales bacterium HSG14]
MKIFLHSFLILTLSFSLLGLFTGCGSKFHHQKFYVFGTLVEVSLWGVSEQKASEAINVITQDFQTMHRHWHAWQPSPLTELNQAIAAGEAHTIQEPSLLLLLKKAKRFYNQSDGLFNPTIGQLIGLWGFHNEDLTSHRSLPSSEKIAELVTLSPGMDDIEIEDNRISSRNPAVQFDFGAFAKGYAVDLAVKKLRELGIQNAIVNAGGNLKAMGKKGDKPWLIGIRHPSGKGVLAAVALNEEESVITSGNYERFFEYEGVRYSHIIDPRKGKPVRGLTSVTVINRSGALADAASTALTVAGLQDWHRIARQMNIKYVMLVDEKGTIYMNPTMEMRVQLPAHEKSKVVISEPL